MAPDTSPTALRLREIAGAALLRLVIEAHAPGGRWHVTSHVRRDRPAWPPSPDTLFSALVASAAAQGEPCDPALYWLETLEMLCVEADARPATASWISYVPVADRTGWETGARQPRHFCSIGSDAPVRWCWALEAEPAPGTLERIARIAAGVTYVGSSRGLVVANASLSATPLPDQALVRVSGGRRRLRTPFPGRLDELEHAFRLGQRARPAPERGYARAADVVREVPDCQLRLRDRLQAPWGPMIPLRKRAHWWMRR